MLPRSQRPPLFPYTTLFRSDAKLATRAAGRDVLQPMSAQLPLLIGGSADLYGSTLNYINADKDFDDTNRARSEEHTSELQSRFDLVCRLLLEKKKATDRLQQ